MADVKNGHDGSPTVDPRAFNRVLGISVGLPLALTLILTTVFVGLVLHLISVLRAVEHVSRITSEAHKTLEILVDSETGMRGFLLTGQEVFLEPYLIGSLSIEKEIESLKDLTRNYAEQTQRMERVRTTYLQFKLIAAELIKLKRSDNSEFLKRVSSGKSRQFMDDIRLEFSEFIRFEEGLRDERIETTQETIGFVILVILGLSVCSGTVLAFYSRRQLKSLSLVFENTLEKQSKLNQSLQREDWLRVGLSQLNELSRGEASISEISAKIINHLARYTGALVGALYEVSDEEGVLRRISTYAFSADIEARPCVIKLKDGLLGQAAADNQLLLVTDLPENYLQVHSGLGAAVPKALLIAPAAAEGSVKAVVELGFLAVPEPRVVELLERVSVGVALTIRSWQYRTRVRTLLDSAQTLNEKLQAQQGEQEGLLTRLQHTQGELEQAVQIRDEFMSIASHELKTPLTSLSLQAQLRIRNLGKGDLSAFTIERLTKMFDSDEKQLDRIARLIDDMLDISRISSGKLAMNFETFDLCELVRDVVERSSGEFAAAGCPIKTELCTSAFGRWDRFRIEQVVMNLLTNSMRYGAGKPILLQVTTSGAGVQIAVRDKGRGIAQENFGRIFQRFERAVTSSEISGLGLGLYIVKQILEAHQGSIRVESEMGQGANFIVELPILRISEELNHGP